MICAEHIAEARAAAAGVRRVTDVLEERLALGPDAFAVALGAALRLPVLRMEELRRLAHRGSLVACLASHEETLRALDTVRAAASAGGEDRQGVEDLSLKAIAGEKSEVVRLVRSTLRDALKIGASG